MNNGGKGSRQRPTNQQTFSDNWDTIFNKKVCQKKCKLDKEKDICLGCERTMKEIVKNGNT